jgi:hypothetical protein
VAVVGKNISSQPILAVVLSIRFALPRGGGGTHLVQHDYFFKPDLVSPGDVLSIVEPLGDSRSVIPLRSHEMIEPYARARVLYAELADGTAFGDEEAGKKIVNLRGRSWELLRQLDQIYRRQGPGQLMRALRQPVENRQDAVHVVPESLLSIANESGPAGAEKAIKKKLTAAARHQEMIMAK